MSKTHKTIWRSDQKIVKDIVSGSSAIDISFDPGGSATVEDFRLHLSAAATTAENFTVSIDSGSGTEYDCQIFSEDMSGISDVWFMPNIRIFDGDKINFSYTNTDALTYGLEVIYRRFDS